MDYFEDIYLKRLNRFGLDYHSRVQNKRELDFELYLLKSVYKVDFLYKGQDQLGILEKYKQDDTETFQYLLTRRELSMPPGTILDTKNNEGHKNKWIICYKEEVAASGYNKYILLKMKHYIEFDDKRGFWCYLKGPQDSVITDTIKSGAIGTVYLEDFNNYILILPKTPLIRKDTYLTMGEDWEKVGYRVTGYDIHSNPGVEYVTLDPVYIRPERDETDKSTENFFWLNGGVSNGS